MQLEKKNNDSAKLRCYNEAVTMDRKQLRSHLDLCNGRRKKRESYLMIENQN